MAAIASGSVGCLGIYRRAAQLEKMAIVSALRISVISLMTLANVLLVTGVPLAGSRFIAV